MKRAKTIVGLFAAAVLSLGLMAAAPGVAKAQAVETSLTTSATADLQTQAVTKYKVWVGGKQVTSKNKGNVLGDAKKSVKYNPGTNTLTLTNARITKAYVVEGVQMKNGFTPFFNYGIVGDTEKTLKINLVGKNSVKMPTKNSPVMNYGVHAKGAIVFAGQGSLTVTSNKAQVYSSGIVANKGLTLQGSVKVVTKGVSTKLLSDKIEKLEQYGGYGVITGGKLTIKGSAQFVASGPDGAIYKNDNPTISFGSGYTPQVKYGASASSTKSAKKPAKSVYTKYKYISISKAKASTKGTFTITSIKNDNGGLYLTWTKSKKAGGFQIQACTARDFKSGSLWDCKFTTAPEGGSYSGITKGVTTNYGLFSGTYYVRGRTFDILGPTTAGNYGKWSAVKKITL